MPIYNFLADPKTQARSTNSFGRVEGAENVSLYLLTHPCSGIRNSDDDTLRSCHPLGCFAAPHQQLAASRHGVDGIADQIAQSLTNLTAEAFDLVFTLILRVAGVLDGEDNQCTVLGMGISWTRPSKSRPLPEATSRIFQYCSEPVSRLRSQTPTQAASVAIRNVAIASSALSKCTFFIESNPQANSSESAYPTSMHTGA